MGYVATEQPACYLVVWHSEGIIKAGYSHCQRWRKFMVRGARLARVEFFPSAHDAYLLESALDASLNAHYPPAFERKSEAVSYMGHDGGGWMECYRTMDIRNALLECDRIADAFCERITAAYARTGRNARTALTQTYSPEMNPAANASRAGGLKDSLLSAADSSRGEAS